MMMYEKSLSQVYCRPPKKVATPPEFLYALGANEKTGLDASTDLSNVLSRQNFKMLFAINVTPTVSNCWIVDTCVNTGRVSLPTLKA